METLYVDETVINYDFKVLKYRILVLVIEPLKVGSMELIVPSGTKYHGTYFFIITILIKLLK